MPQTQTMRTITHLFILLLCACNTSAPESTVTHGDESEFTYEVLIKDNNKYIFYLSEDINNKISRNAGNREIVLYDSLTRDYLKYIADIEFDIKKNTSAILFRGDKYSPTGKQLIKKTTEYKTAIEKLVQSENLKKRINLALNTNDVKILNKEVANNNENGSNELNTTYSYYLAYYFKNLPNSQVLANLSAKKKTILEIENEFIESGLR